jgi:hypothetical protein
MIFPDYTLDAVTNVRSSRHLTFDVAARDRVQRVF